MRNKSDCWIENTNSLFKEYHSIIPHSKMNLACRINCITRLLIYTIILLFIFQIVNTEYVIIYFLSVLLIIMMVYYKEKEKMKQQQQSVENFEIIYTPQSQNEPPTKQICNTRNTRINYHCQKPDDNTFVTEKKVIKEKLKLNDYTPKNNYNVPDYNLNFETVTDNQSLVGCANPKTLIPPIIAPPLASLENWKNDDSYGISILNEKKNTYYKESGYDVDTNFHCPTNYKTPILRGCSQKVNKVSSGSSYSKVNESQPQTLPPLNAVSAPPTTIKEAFTFPYEIKSQKSKKEDINNSDNLFHKDFKSNPMFDKKYDEDIFTQTINPGNYKLNTRNEPINSNMGITLAEQNQESNYEMIEPFEGLDTSNVYDPRFYGYGTTYRGYVDKNLGQPRFYYDDVNAVRMPNYISRNKIDVMPFGDTYGPDNDGGNKYHGNITALADKHYLDSSLQFRTEMQDRLMRKINANQWQQRMFPINTNGQRMTK